MTAAQVHEAVLETARAIDPSVEVGTPQYDIVCDTWYIPLRRVAEVVSLLVLTQSLCDDFFGPKQRQEEWVAKVRQCIRELRPGQKLPEEE